MSQETTRDMSNNKLKIRIQIQQPPQAIEEIYPEPEVTYEETLDWNKIAIAAALLLAILVLTGYLLFSSSGTETTADETIVSGHTAAAVSGQAVSPEKTEAEPGTTGNTTGTQPGESISVQKPPAKPAEPNTKPVAPKPVPIPAKKPQRILSDNAGKAVPKTAVQVKPQQTSDHAEVIRAQLSHAIDAREPVDSIDTVQLQPGESKPIHFYLHLKNMRGKKIRIDWYYNDKLDSKLNLQVHNNNWRTHASKQLDQRRLGEWRVELIDESGNQLASRKFTVTEQ
ncbi:DUF2914 domain-containing protein [Nitrosomonas oligotropha]|uniref:DUF2914 domain-containing protein n=1 Tax=Nitrosomonas oligotropha TaxID=42354 RepID=A0A1H8K762_9PROT|nr:DUF2914 domain-containing protein [Nitrosomonas oligotropha]SDW28195.1 Protein of unknown function [Nitrosomonas oligotropha]SEN88840.1 Protein of unknown function [Nitrosomonas oligotropha]